MKKYKCVIWDWNGTLIDDLKINIDIINRLLKARSLPEIESLEAYLEGFCFPIISFYEKLGFDLVKEDFKLIAREYASLYDELYPGAEIFSDTVKLLEKIKESGIRQLIISQTEQGYLSRQVAYFDLEHLFTDIVGNSNIFAGGKVEMAKKWLESENLRPEEVLFVGDTIHDKEVADEAGCDCVLISRGHNSERRLKLTGAPVLSSAEQLYKIIL